MGLSTALSPSAGHSHPSAWCWTVQGRPGRCPSAGAEGAKEQGMWRHSRVGAEGARDEEEEAGEAGEAGEG